MKPRTLPLAAAVGAAVVAATLGGSVASAAAGPPAAATAFTTAVIGTGGGSISGFGVTATFAPGAVSSDRLIILGNWPNGLDVPPPNGESAVKTFGLQECAPDGTACTSEFGNFPNSPAGTEKVRGAQVPFTGYQRMPDLTTGNTNFGSAAHKLVTITVASGADKVYVYNANNTTTQTAYPALLPSASGNGTVTFQTFQPIVWVLTDAGATS
jgi:hypothetical protein